MPDAEVLTVVSKLRQNPAVAYAEPNYLETASATPNDPEFTKQWGDENTGQLIPFQDGSEKLGAEEKGTPRADDHASLAWGVTTGSRSIVIGEVDTGAAYEHPDLSANIWSNPGGINGCAAGTHGENVLAKTCNPIDEDNSYNGHGTHVAGIMGAVGNNGVGVAGMNWQTTILPVRWMNNGSSGETSALIEALQWLVAAKQAGVNVRVANDSDTFPGTAKSEALSNEIETLGANEILFVTAAGNTSQNNDTTPRYPCSYERPTEICVTASNNNDLLPSWANIGPKSVQLAAPGVSIYSTLRGNSYGWLSGGSMASAQVAGAAALILSTSPSMTTKELRADILNNVDKLSAFEGKVSTAGRLDVCKALSGCTVPPPPPTCGKTSVGGLSDSFASERKRVNRCSLPVSGSVTKLSLYLAQTSTSGQQVMKGIIYSDVSGKPEKLLAVSEELTFKHENSAGWYDLPFASPVNLSAGNYWIGVTTGPTNGVAGFRWDSAPNSRDYNANTYSSGPTNPFGSVSTDNELTSLYATYTTAPAVETNSASEVKQTSATLNASVNPNGGEVSACKFEYGTSTSYGKSATCMPAPGGGTSAVSVSAAVAGLSPNTEYHFRVVATNAGGTSKGSDQSFKTLPNIPTVVTEAASSITKSSATLNASVNPNGQAVSDCHFDYGTTMSYGASVACSSLPGSGESPVAVSASVMGLSANTTHHFRIVATNPGGTSLGVDQVFTTLSNAGTGHYYNNNVLLGSQPLAFISWGTITLKTVMGGSGEVTCHSVSAGKLSNPAGGGGGKAETKLFATYRCEQVGICPEASTVALAPEALPWLWTLEAPAGAIRARTAIKVSIGCFAGGEQVSATKLVGSIAPSSQNGTSALHPSFLEFDPGSGILEVEGSAGQVLDRPEGELKILGYQEQELISTR